MSFKYQRKSLRFAPGRGLKITTASGPLTILGPAISGTGLTDITATELLTGYDSTARNAFTATMTADGFAAPAVTETAKMWDVLARCTQCIVDNRLATQP